MDGELFCVLKNMNSINLESIDEGLSSAIETYARRSQAEELIKSYIKAFKSYEHDVLWLPKTRRSFQSCCESLHFETVLRIWTLLIDEFKSSKVDNATSLDLQKTWPLVRLLDEFIKSICIDHIPEKVSLQVVYCLLETQKLAVDFIELCLKLKDATHVTTGFLRLLESTGILILKLCQHSTFQEHFCANFEDEEPICFFSFNSIFRGFTDELSAQMHMLMTSGSDQLAYMSWINLLLFKVKWSSSEHLEFTTFYPENIKQLCDFLVFDLLESVNFNEADEFSKLYWPMICHSYHSFYEYFAKLCRVRGWNNKSVLCEQLAKYNSVLCKKLVESLCDGSAIFQETTTIFFSRSSTNLSSMSDLLSQLCSVIFERLGKLLRPRHKKHKKSDASNEGLNDVLLVLDSLAKPLPEVVDESIQKLISDPLNTLLSNSIDRLKNEENNNDEFSIVDVARCFDVLLYHVVPFVDSVQKFRCTVASVTTLLCRRPCNDETITHCLEITAECLCDKRCVTLLLKFLAPEIFCHWISLLHDYFSTRMKYACFQELCSRIFKLFVSVVLKNPDEIKRIRVFFKKICKDMKVCQNSGFAGRQWCNFKHILLCSNLINKELNQHFIRPDCLPLLKKLQKTLLATINSSIESLQNNLSTNNGWKESNETGLFDMFLDAALCLLKGMKIASKKKVKRDSETQEDENELLIVLKIHLDIFKQISLDVLRSSEDSKALFNSLDFVNELCTHRESFDLDIFVIEAWDAVTGKLKHLSMHRNDEDHPSLEQIKIDLETQLCTVASQLLSNMKKNELMDALKEFFVPLGSKDIHWPTVEDHLRIWQNLLSLTIKEEIHEVFIHSSLRVIFLIRVLLRMSPPTRVAVQMLKTLSSLLDNKLEFVRRQELSVLLHFTYLVDLDSFPNKDTDSSNYRKQLNNFIQVFHSYHDILNSLLHFHSHNIRPMIPSYLAGLIRLLRASMWAGQQQPGINLSSKDLEDLENCALLVARLAKLMSEHESDYGDIVQYLVAEFADCSQRVTLYPIVKRALLQAVYIWLDTCKKYALGQLQVALPPGAKEIFRDIYSGYQKYHKYQGKN